MKRTGFTLVELLVVVLIIGVLTAVAVPMYQSAVDKSHFSTMLPGARAIKNAEEAYWLANGYYTNDETSLDVSAPAQDVTFTYELKEDGAKYNAIKATNSKLANVRLASYLDDNVVFGGQIHCEALKTDERANKLCEKTLHGTQILETDDHYLGYMLDGTLDASTCGLAGFFWSTSKEKCYLELKDKCDALDMNVLNERQCGYDNDNSVVIKTEGICDGSNSSGCAWATIKNGGVCNASSYYACSHGTVKNGGVCRVEQNMGCQDMLDVESGGVCEVGESGRGCYSSSTSSFKNGALCMSLADSSKGGGYGCQGGTVQGVTVCRGNGSYCAYNTKFSNGICLAENTDASRACWSTFENGAICYANTEGTGCSDTSRYKDEESCCCGNYCGSARYCGDDRCNAALATVNTLLENGGYDIITTN